MNALKMLLLLKLHKENKNEIKNVTRAISGATFFSSLSIVNTVVSLPFSSCAHN